jgi:uncharacterized protein YdeI (BOF family)
VSTVSHPAAGPRASGPLAALVSASLFMAALAGVGSPEPASALEAATVPDHLVVSELVTGGAGASDEYIELYNPTSEALPLEGLELVYVSASGLTISRRTAWDAGAPELPPGRHVLLANELGIYAGIADATYASGMAASGGSVALRIVGASSPIDAVGWGSAASSWMEGIAAPAPAAGESLERLPGGSSGSTRDTDDNASDFAVRTVPSPENTASPPVPDPGWTASPVPSGSASPSPVPSPTPTTQPTPTPGPTVLPIDQARAQPDGTSVTIEGVALTGSGFNDGGGYVADASGSLAVLLTEAIFERGDLLRISGELDDRYAQRTLRAAAQGMVRLGFGAEPSAAAAATGAIDEAFEGRLVQIAGTIAGSPTQLSSGPAFDVDDGSGPVRVLVATSTGIDVTGWSPGATVDLVGVVGQRDATGSGTAGYRVQPRDTADVRSVEMPPAATASPTPSAAPTPSDGPDAGVITIAEARQLPKNARATIRGVVTLVPGLVDPVSAVVQDTTGAILLRAGEEVGPLVRGTLVEVDGVRSTLAGMETIRIVAAPRSLGSASEPSPRSLRTGDAGESHESALVTVRGALVAAPRRSTAGTVSFEIDDGSGPLRISIASAARIDVAALWTGTWIEVRGPLGQETTGSQPLRGYRVWPRDAADLRVTTPATNAPSATGGSGGATTSGGAASANASVPPASLDAVGTEVDPGLPVGATLVTGPWEELGLGGLLWDGTRLLGLEAHLAGTMTGFIGGGRAPVAVEIVGLRTVGVEATTGIAVADFRADPGSITPAASAPAPPRTSLPTTSSGPQWVAIIGRMSADGSRLVADGAAIPIERRCATAVDDPRGVVSVTGIATVPPSRLIVPCGGVVPAPTLSRGNATASTPAVAAAMTSGGAARPEDRQPGGSPVALLLVAAAATLVAGAMAMRRIAGGPETDEPAEDAIPDEGEPATAERDALPSLTLVAVPRERAP